MWQSRIVGHADIDPRSITPHPSNFRTHPQHQAEATEGNIDDLGWIRSVIVNKRSGRCIDGHLRIELAVKKGEPTIPVEYVDLSEHEEAQALATIDPLAALAETNRDALKAVLDQVATSNEAVVKMLEDLAVENHIIPAGVEPGAGGDEFDTTPQDGPTRCKAGDLWIIGGVHRLLCGDSTKAEDVARVMDGEKADICATDPPYGVGLEYASHNDSDLTAYWELMDGWQIQAKTVSPLIVATVGYKHNCEWFARYKPDSFCVWVDTMKQSPHKVAYLCKSEIVMVWGKVPERWAWDTWQVNSIRGDGLRDEHPCPKPVALWMEILKPESYKRIYEPFCGSGTTLIAAHRLGRRCYGIEIEPRYCDVILRRCEAEGLSVQIQ